MKKAIAVAAAILLLAGCTAGSGVPAVQPDKMDGDFTYTQVVLPDGRSVPCLFWTYSRQGGMSCDWEAAR